MLIECPGQGQCFRGRCQVLLSIRDGFFYPSQAHQHGDIFPGMSLRLSQVEIFLPAPAPLQDVEPGLCQIIGIIWSFTLPGSLFGNGALQNALERGIVPAVEGRSLRRVKGLIDAVVIEFLLPGSQLVSPLLSLLAGQVSTQNRFRPGCPEITEKPACLAIRVVQVFPLAQVFSCDGLKYSERLAAIVSLDQLPRLIDELSYLVDHRANVPVDLRTTHAIQAVNDRTDLPSHHLRIHSNMWLRNGLRRRG